MTDVANVVECRGLSKRFGRNWALHDCTLAIPAGRIVALVGPNGAGKTTLLHMAGARRTDTGLCPRTRRRGAG